MQAYVATLREELNASETSEASARLASAAVARLNELEKVSLTRSAIATYSVPATERPSPRPRHRSVSAEEERAEAAVVLDAALRDNTKTKEEIEKVRAAAAEAQAAVDAELARQRAEGEAMRARVARETARLREIGMDNTKQFNFAVCGNTGTGKSTFINVMRGVWRGDPAAAEVGTGRQVTLQTTKYVHPADASIVLWDVPGGATDNFPSATYFEDRCLDLFDGIVLLYSGRFTEVRAA